MPDQATRYPGVYAAMPTPLTAERAIDHAGIQRVVDYLLGAGLDGLSILGSTGECSGLTRAQRLETLETVVEAVRGRATVFTGAAGTVVSDVAEDLKAAEGRGAVGALVPPPFYYPLNTAGVVNFFEPLAEVSPLPIILYNIPRMTKVSIAVEAVERLAQHPNIMGIKDSSGDFGYFTQIARVGVRAPGFTVLTGADGMLAASLLVGGHGVIGGGVNIVPEVMVALYRAFRAGDHAKAVDLQAKVADAVAAVRAVGVFPAAHKATMALRGLCEPYPVHPIPPLTEAETAELRRRLVEHGVISA